MRIGYVINRLQVGGAEILLLNFIKKIAPLYTVFVYTLLQRNPILKEFSKSGAIIRKLHMRNNKEIWNLLHLRTLMKMDSLDIVHTHLCDADLYGRLAGKLAGVRVIISTLHSMDTWKRKKDIIRQMRSSIDLFSTRFCSAIICVSKAVADYHERWGINKTKIQVIHPYNLIVKSTKSKMQIRKKLNIPANHIVITNVGRAIPEKNQQLIIQCSNNVLRDYKNVTFLIVGDGPCRVELEHMVKNTNKGKYIRILGTRSDVNDILRASDIFVLPSTREGFPQTLIEAMSEGLAVIANTVGGIPEIIDKSNGILITPGDQVAFCKSVLSLCGDEALRSKLGKNAQKTFINNRNFDKYVGATVDLYENLLSQQQN